MDNVIHAHEIAHSLKIMGNKGMVIQINLSKAYDRVSWEYMEAILNVFGFDNWWISSIMYLVTSPIFLILVNGAPAKPFLPSQGIC